MLQNTKVIAFIVSELLRENQQGVKLSPPPRLGLHVQAICDSQGNFMDAEFKWPGPVHNAKVALNSYVCEILQNGKLATRNISLLTGFEAMLKYLI